jgi:hypothetical protein
MLIDGTSDKIQFKLNAAVTTNQLTFTADYTTYTSTSATLSTNNGTSNNTTAVDIVTSPAAASQQNELRYCAIYNSDTAPAIVLIQIYDGTNTRQVFKCTLNIGFTLQYQLEKGWEVLDISGNKRTMALNSFRNSYIGNVGWRFGVVSSASTRVQLTSTTWFHVYIGRAEKAYTSIDVCYNVAVAFVGTVAEIALYSATWKSAESTGNNPGIRRGVTNVASVINTTGTKVTTITLNQNGGVSQGDYMCIVFYNTATTAASLQSTGQSDSTAFATQGSSAVSITGGIPSSVPTGVYFAANPVQNIALMWKGT